MPRPLPTLVLAGIPLGRRRLRRVRARGGPPTTAGGPIAVKATDTECEVAAPGAAGTSSFNVTNSGHQGHRVLHLRRGRPGHGRGREHRARPLTRDLNVELPAGHLRDRLQAGHDRRRHPRRVHRHRLGRAAGDDAKLAAATASYERYVKSQTDALLAKTQEFVDAVKAGDVAKAKALFPVARTYWERIEPVAEIFGDLDPKIDGREDDIEEGMAFTGFHRLEKDLWTAGDTPSPARSPTSCSPTSRRSSPRPMPRQLTPLQLANGAKELLDEVATGKITGEEDRYSHTDLWDFDANVEGSQAAVAALRPVLEERDPDLVPVLDERFAAVETVLDKYRAVTG